MERFTLPLLLLLSGCSTLPPGQDTLSYDCQRQWDAHREQPPLRDSREHKDRPPIAIAPISDGCRREMGHRDLYP